MGNVQHAPYYNVDHSYSAINQEFRSPILGKRSFAMMGYPENTFNMTTFRNEDDLGDSRANKLMRNLTYSRVDRIPLWKLFSKFKNPRISKKDVRNAVCP